MLSLPTAQAQVVINEVFYDSPDRTKSVEFIELHNSGNAAVDLSNWQFDSGINFTFASGTSLGAGSFIVVAQDPASFQAQYGFAPLGPWTGKLANEGERVRLRNASGVTMDELTYGEGFPWPTAARGLGASLELLNPGLDNSRAGSWRASGTGPNSAERVFVPPISTTWRYRKGTSEPSNPVSDWRQVGFVEDSTWTTGQTSVGFGDGDDSTVLSDMQNNYSSIYLRRLFTVQPGEIPAALTLRARVDDGCVVWINGIEVARLHVPAGALSYNSNAFDHEANAVTFEEVTISNAASILTEGTNVIAIHALNAGVGSSDFSIDAQLLSSITATSNSATPGAANSVFDATAPPAIEAVAHSPNQPVAGQAVTITAKVLPVTGGNLGNVTLQYQRVAPGGYIRKADSSYTTNWTSVSMNDSGTNGDLAVGDSIYTGVLPANLQTHRYLVRYRIIAADGSGNSVSVPYSDDAQPNFAYFVYNGPAAWSGSFDLSSPVQTFPASLMQAMPAYHLIANSADVTNSQYVSSYDGVRMWGTLVYNGKVYDHIQFHNRGEFSTYASGKNKWRIRFNTARDFEPLDNWGKPYPEKWDTLFLNTCASPWAAVNRGMAGVEEALSFRFQALAGVPTPRSHFIQWRVIDDFSETPNGSQFSAGNPNGTTGGDLWGLYNAIEPIDGSFLDARGLPDGNIYKIESNVGDKKHQGATQPTDNSDSIEFRAASGGNQTEAWWRANMDLPGYYSFQAANRALGNVDIREGWNHYFYHNPDGRWTPVPWDMDMMFSPKTQQTGVILQKNCVTIPAIGIEYRNRCRELLDLMLSDSSIAGGQMGQLIDEYAQLVNPSGQSLTWADLDAALWNRNPRTVSSPNRFNTNHFGNFYRTPYEDTRIGGNWIRSLATSDHEGFMKYLLDYSTNTFPAGSTWAVNNGNALGYGYKYVEFDSADTLIPNRPTATSTSSAGFPVNNIRFASSGYSSPQGAGSFAAVQWRVGEISAPGIPLYDPSEPRIYELSDVWRSEEIPSAAGDTRIPPTSLKVGHTYRARVRHKDITGRWSRWSPAVQFVAGAANAAVFQQNLTISELMYNPAPISAAETAAGFSDRQDFEFLELQNVGTSPLDLTDVTVTGITFAFPADATIAAGARVLLVKNAAAFNFRYGSGKPIAGTFTAGNLDNAGEALSLSFAGTPFLSFAYSDGSHPATGQTIDPWPTQPDGAGYSLVLINPESRPNLGVASNWRASRKLGGSAGSPDTVSFATWAAEYPGIGGPANNVDGDDRRNDFEYAFGSNPTIAEQTPAAASSLSPFTVAGISGTYLSTTFKRQVGATDLLYAVEFSPNLIDWTESGVLDRSTPNGDGTVTEVWRSSAPAANYPRLFVRVRTSGP